MFRIIKRSLTSYVKHLSEHKALIVENYGEPVDSVILKTRKPQDVLPKKLESDQILVEHLAACIHPSDIMLAQGKYGIKPALPTVLGGEGVTRVLAVGDAIKNLEPGDMAFGTSYLGYWQSFSVQDGKTFHKVGKDLEATTAAQLRLNPATAYRMMKDFVTLKPGDTMLQNGANSAVGVYAIQLAKHWGIKTINVIRDRPNKTAVIDELKDYGADVVVTEEELRDEGTMKPIIEKVGSPRLCLNCVSGKNATGCLRILADRGYLVTYGWMSKQPLITGPQVMFRRQKIEHFWMSDWFKDASHNEVSQMLNELANFFKVGILKTKPHTLISFEERNVAFTNPNNTKYIFSISTCHSK